MMTDLDQTNPHEVRDLPSLWLLGSVLLMAIGETARADHFSLNGHARPTNPELASLGVLSFRQVIACGTSTAASLPCMFSRLGKAEFEARTRDREQASRRDTPLTHDNQFPTVVGMLGISAPEYRQDLDAFAACRSP